MGLSFLTTFFLFKSPIGLSFLTTTSLLFKFDESFTNLAKLSVYNNFVDKNMCKVLVDVLRLEESLEKVVVSGYLWGVSKTENELNEKVKYFLNELGLKQSAKSFSLVKFERQGQKEWKAFEMQDHQIMDNLFSEYKMNHFYSDVNAFSKTFSKSLRSAS